MTQIAILGFGIVGSGAAEVLTTASARSGRISRSPIVIKKILDLRTFPDSPFGHLITHDFNEILSDPDISIVVEAMGGAHPAYDFTKTALEAGKSVVTSNKQVVASFGAELLTVAKEHGVRYLFEASVGGGIPIIHPLTHDFAANRITRIDGILNGTTNYMLTRMIAAGIDFSAALFEAQQKGYAEADPTADVEGFDAARKIVILAALAFGKLLCPDKIPCRGISSITTDDTKTAATFGYALKLIAHAEKIGERVLCTVEPRLVKQSHQLAHVDDVFNGVLINGDQVGDVLFYGQGAGRLPTASAVAADVIEAALNPAPTAYTPVFTAAKEADYADPTTASAAFCFSFSGNEPDAEKVRAVFGNCPIVTLPGRVAVISYVMTRRDAEKTAAAVGLPLLSCYPLL